MAAPARFHDGACGRLESRPTTWSGDSAAATVTRCSELVADRALERWSVLVAVSLLHDEWSQARWPSCSGMQGRLRGHVARRHRRQNRRWQHVTTPRHAGEESTSSACAKPRATCAGHTVRCRRSSAGLGRLSGQLCQCRLPPCGTTANIYFIFVVEITGLITVIAMVLQSSRRSPDPPWLALSVARAPHRTAQPAYLHCCPVYSV